MGINGLRNGAIYDTIYGTINGIKKNFEGYNIRRDVSV